MAQVAISVIVFLSGASALIFENLFLRLSGLTFGNSVWATALILSSFMAGLAFGSLIGARLRLIRVRPLHVYAALELAIGVFGWSLVYVLPSLGTWLRPLFQQLWAHQPLLLDLRFILSFVLLLIPTTAMGLTLPVIAAAPLLREPSFGRVIGLLYGCNTIGAVAGTLLGETWLIGAFGLFGTAFAAAVLNCIAAALAIIMSRSFWRTRALAAEDSALLHLGGGRRFGFLLFAGFGSGAILLCLEVVWFRFLRLYVASSTLSFAIMLAVVLAGIGLGGLIFSTIPQRVANWRGFLPLLCIVAGFATSLSYLLFPVSVRAQAGPFYLDRWREITLLSAALMLPAALVSGVIFPAIIARVQERIGSRMNSVGLTTLCNTVGATIGPLLAAFVLLPSIGFQASLLLCASAYVLLSVFLAGELQRSRKSTEVAVLVGWGSFVLLLALFPYRREESHFTHARLPFTDEGAYLVRKVEGTADTAQLLRTDYLAQPYSNQLLVDAFTMSSTTLRNQRYMRLFAYLPLTLRPEAEDALLICYGCGVTAHALTTDSHLKRIDVVDIAKEVLRLAPYYSTPNLTNPLVDPRVRTTVQDGRFFLEATPQQYDLITGEPPPPKVAGSVNLYTKEFFSLMRDRLKEGGIATFWLPMYQLTPEENKAILHSFHEAFPNCSVWGSIDHEWIMMGVKGATRRITPDELGRLSRERAGDYLRQIGVEVPEQLLALFVMDAREIERISRDTPPLTDNWPKRLTNVHPDEQVTRKFAWTYLEAGAATQRFLSSPVASEMWPDIPQGILRQLFTLREARYLAGAIGSNGLAELDLYLRHSRLRVPVLEVLQSNELRVAIAEKVATDPKSCPREALPSLVAGALARRDISGAVNLLEIQRLRGAAGVNDLYLLTYLYCLNGEVPEAEKLAAQFAESVRQDWFAGWLWNKLGAEFGFRLPD